MTTWRFVTPLWLILFLSTVDLSEEHCVDYFKIEEWKDNLTDTVPLIEPMDKSWLKCTLANANYEKFDEILDYCFEETNISKIRESCTKNTSKKITVLQLICLMTQTLDSKSIPESIKAVCEFETVCRLYQNLPSTADPTTTLQERTTAATTTSLPPTTTLQETTAAAATAVPTTTTTTTTAATLQETTTTAAVTTTTSSTTTLQETPEAIKHGTFSGVTGTSSRQMTGENKGKEVLILTVFLIISLILNVAMLLGFYLQRCNQSKQDCSKFCNPNASVDDDDDGAGNSTEVERMNEEVLPTHHWHL